MVTLRDGSGAADGVLLMTTGVVMSKVMVLVAVFGVPAPSVAVTTTIAELAEVGLPENRPVVVSKLRPTGMVPELML